MCIFLCVHVYTTHAHTQYTAALHTHVWNECLYAFLLLQALFSTEFVN